MQFDQAARRRAIETALLDYHRIPGKYSRARRQPPLLYEAIKEILQMASGRAPDVDAGPLPGRVVQQAAGFFIRSALLHPDASHYAILGLAKGADVAAVKDRYRAMMRLMHPDFAAALTVAVWPADAATRLNLAYEVLSSPVQRREYDEQIGHVEGEGHTTPGQLTALRSGPPARHPHEHARRGLKRLSLVFGAVGGVALVAAGIVRMQADKESLVQRADAAKRQAAAPARHPPQEAALQAAPAFVPAEHAAEDSLATGVTHAPSALDTALMPPAFDRVQAVAAMLPPGPRPVAATPRGAPGKESALAADPVSIAQSRMLVLAPAPAPAAAAAPSFATPAALPGPGPALALAAPAAPLPPATELPAPTLTEVHPMLARLLQEIESGWGDRVMGLVDRDARNALAGQALLQHYNALVDGMRPVKVSNVQFNAQPREGRLLVTGHLTMQPYDRAAPPRSFAVQAEFTSRQGAVVMTRLARAPD